MLLDAVKAGLTGWQAITAAIRKDRLTVQGDDGRPMSIEELEPHILAAEDARDAASRHAADRIDRRHN